MMPRKSILIQISLVGTVLLGFMIGVYLAAGRRVPKPDPSGKIVGHAIDTDPAEVLKYWTADKMRNAKPADMPHVTARRPGKEHPRRHRHTSDPEQS